MTTVNDQTTHAPNDTQRRRCAIVHHYV